MELDDAYANGAYVEGADDYPARWLEAARSYSSRLETAGRARMGLRYGTSERALLDLFYPEQSPRGLLVFVHGGYWRKFDRSYWSHLAEGAVGQGWAVAMPSYDLCPDVSICAITTQISEAVKTAAGLVEGPVCLCGHSAGGHLVARMLAPGLLDPAVLARLQRVMPISPVADLRPLLKTSMNADFKLSEAEAAAESPVLQPRSEVAVTVWVGALERPAFLDQARWLAQSWQAEHVIAPDKHHFDVIEPLSNSDSHMIKRLLL